MKLRIVIPLILFLTTGCASTSQNSIKWEYKTVVLNPFESGILGRQLDELNNEYFEKQKSMLNALGENGWELVQISGNNHIFKRQIGGG